MLSLDQLSQTVQEHLLFAGGTLSSKWKITTSPLGGRGLISTQDISTGEIIFVDAPLVCGPRTGSITQRGCTVCCKIEAPNFFKCHKCSLLLCSDDCQNTELHTNDCTIISRWENKIPIEEMDENILSKALAPMRALMLGEMQRELLASLQAHVAPQHGNEIKHLQTYFAIPEEDEKFLYRVCCAFDANAFQTSTSYGSEDLSMRGLYPVSSLMNHNCVPNTSHVFDKELRMVVRAVKPIRAGSEIFSSYSGTFWGTPSRRHHLYKTKHFLCNCERCSDPTERGTLLSALKCFSLDCPGSLLPVEPLNTSSSWRCLDCSMVVPAKNVVAVQNALGGLMRSLDFENVSQLENFLVNRVTKFIPKTNQIVVDLQCRLIWLLGEKEGLRWHELSEWRLRLKERLCRDTLRTAAALGLGETHVRGMLLYHLHATLAERARRTPALYEDLKSEIESTIEHASNILEGDISAPPDLKLRRRYLGPGTDKSHQERFFILEA